MKSTTPQREQQSEKASPAEDRAAATPFAMPAGYQSYYGVGSSPVQLRRATVAGPSTEGEGGGGGSPLPGDLRSQMERSLGADFSDVRAREDSSATKLGADAYTRGNEVTFAPGRFNPSSSAGKELIGHELAHVVQQRQGRVSATQAKGGPAINSEVGLEREADEQGARAARGAPAAQTAETPGSAPASQVAQLKRGKVQSGWKLWLCPPKGTRPEAVYLFAGTEVDITDGIVKCLSGAHNGWSGELQEDPTRQVEFEPEQNEKEIAKHLVYKSCSASFVGFPQAISISGNFLSIVTLVQTRNVYDRMDWRVAFVNPITGKKTSVVGAMIVDSNPAWSSGGKPIGSGDYTFKKDFAGFSGGGEPSALRLGEVRVPIDRMKNEFVEFSDNWTDTGIGILVGIKMYYSNLGPTVCSTKEQSEAYEATDYQAHMYGYEAMSTPQELGKVTFSDEVKKLLKIERGKEQSKEQFHQQPLGENPPNSLENPFPPSYPQDKRLFEPLAPVRYLGRDKDDKPSLELNRKSEEIMLKLQTRIENEATLKVSSGEALRAIVGALTAWGKDGDVTAIMSQNADPLLQNFTWTLEKKNPVVFTDVYLDDKSCHALKAGIGIRKRRSKEAAKLNVKTGKGQNVYQPQGPLVPKENYPEGPREEGKETDIWRRHEIGFSLNPNATPGEIGAFLDSGSDGSDPWNLGAQQANDELKEGQKIDFKQLEEKMVLVGNRTKFNLKAAPKTGSGTINIEISCDHTVGCRPNDWNPNTDLEEFDFVKWYRELNEKSFPETFNVEMELEHLGAGGAQTSGGNDDSQSTHGGIWGAPSEIKKQNEELKAPPLGPPQGYPQRRPYVKKDTESLAFGTPSFSVFYAAHKKLIEELKGSLRLPKTDLTGDVQKLEAIRDELHLVDNSPEREKTQRDPGFYDRPGFDGTQLNYPRKREKEKSLLEKQEIAIIENFTGKTVKMRDIEKQFVVPMPSSSGLDSLFGVILENLGYKARAELKEKAKGVDPLEHLKKEYGKTITSMEQRELIAETFKINLELFEYQSEQRVLLHPPVGGSKGAPKLILRRGDTYVTLKPRTT